MKATCNGSRLQDGLADTGLLEMERARLSQVLICHMRACRITAMRRMVK